MINTTILPYLNAYKSYPIYNNIDTELITVMNKLAIYLLGKYSHTEINLWGTGTSGLTICVLLAQYIPNARIQYLEKEGVTSHKQHVPTFFKESFRSHILLDDVISTGATIDRFLNIYEGCIWDELVILHPTDHIFLKNCKDRFKHFCTSEIIYV